MNKEEIRGVVSYSDGSLGDDYLFRVALKAVIFNNERQILLVKEKGRDWWDIPGGGLNHGESISQGFARELREEVGFEGEFTFEPLAISEPLLLPSRRVMQVGITCVVRTTSMGFKPGADGDEIMFMDPDRLKDSTLLREQEIYRYSQLARARL